MTEVDPAEWGDDDLVDAAAQEQAGRIAADRQQRAWMIAVSASAIVVLAAVTAISWLTGTLHAAPDRTRALPTSAVAPDLLDGMAGAIVLATIPLPAGWTAAPATSGDVFTADQVIRWETAWTAPSESTDGPRVIAAALAGDGWQRCTGGEAKSECWQRAPDQLQLTWGPGAHCPSSGPCSRASVVLLSPAPTGTRR